MTTYKVLPGPEGILPPAAMSMGVAPPEPGWALLEGTPVSEDEAIEAAARRLATAKVPTFFPGPLVLWEWTPKSHKVADAVLRCAESNNIRIIPMADYRPKYPKIEPEFEINPNHPNLTIWHNKIDACLFVGVHCHYANLSLKIIRGGTSCFTMAFCSYAGHEDANLTIRDNSAEKFDKLSAMIKKMKVNSAVR